MKKSLFILLLACCARSAASPQWTPEQANEWYATQPWLVGANYVPATAISQLEMWQAETFDPERIDLELGWAEGLGFNTMRVFLHDIPWKTDSAGFLKRIDRFLDICQKHKIRPMFVFFDSCWNPDPKPGKQPSPKPHVHNSGWVQSPGWEILRDPAKQDTLKPYVVGVVGHFKDDQRILAWDVYNEPNNENGGRFKEDPNEKFPKALMLLKKAFEWARGANPSQPLSSGIWIGDFANPNDFQKVQLESSDIINFHCYSGLEETRKKVDALRKYNRPIMCSEYMARPQGSTFQAVLPYFKEQKVIAMNWGFVDGRSQTIYPWDSWNKEYKGEPDLWFHDIFHRNGTPYKKDEVELIRSFALKK